MALFSLRVGTSLAAIRLPCGDQLVRTLAGDAAVRDRPHVGISAWWSMRRAERAALELVSVEPERSRHGVAYRTRIRNCGGVPAADVVVLLVDAGEPVVRGEPQTVPVGAEISTILVARAATTVGVDVGPVALIRRKLPSASERAQDLRG